MNELQIFNNSEFGEMRTSSINGETWFCLADICRPLGIQSSDCRKRLNPRGVDTIQTPTRSGTQTMIFVNEGNFYKAVFQSKKPEAEKFTDWVTCEVLPTLRKTGTYTAQPTTPAQLMLQQAQLIVDMERRIDTMETLVLDVGVKAEQAIAKAEAAVKVYAQPDKDHWTQDMAAAIATLNETLGCADCNLRGRLYKDLEHTAGNTDLDARLRRLRKRMKNTGMTYRDAMSLNKLDAVAADRKLRAIFESVVHRWQAQAT